VTRPHERVWRLLCIDSSGHHARGDIGNLPVAVVWLFPLLKWVIRVSFQLPGSHLLQYPIPGDVPRSFLSSYLGIGPCNPLHSAQILSLSRSELPARALSAYIPSSCSSSDQGVMPLFVAVTIDNGARSHSSTDPSNPMPYHIVNSGLYFGGWETAARISSLEVAPASQVAI